MIRNTKYIATYNCTNKTIDENIKDIYDSLISKRDDYKKTNQYIFILTIHESIQVYQLLKIENTPNSNLVNNLDCLII